MRRLILLMVCALIVPASSARAWTWPAEGKVIRPFAFDAAHPYAGGQHRGVDIGGAEGGSVRAPVDAVVTFAGVVPGGGKTVSLETAIGYVVTLQQLGSIRVARGDAVTEGVTELGTVGGGGTVRASCT